MAHTLQDRYVKKALENLRASMVCKDGLVANTYYEGDPKAGAVKIPYRADATASTYSKANGLTATIGGTDYKTITLDEDVAVNELIDGYDAAAVPDALIAQRLVSATYALANANEVAAITELEANATTFGTTTALTTSTAYKTLVEMAAKQTTNKVPMDGRRWAIVSPEIHALLLQDSNFIRQGDISQNLVADGVVGKCAGFNILVSAQLNAKTEIIVGHPEWFAHVQEFTVMPQVVDLAGSAKYVGASAVQARMVSKYAVLEATTVLIKKTA